MWRVVGTSVIGTSHKKLQTPCQDSCEYYSCILGSERALLIAIADGAGSAKASEIGSRETVQHLLQTISRSGRSIFEIDEEIAAGWLLDARDHLTSVATRENVAVRDLACTVLFAILAESCAVFGQVGDGAWIAQADGTYFPATWPSGGEYANQTTFITSPNWREVMQLNVIRKPVAAVAGFSDGLQNVALHFGSRSVHEPFFESKFNALRSSDDETSLTVPLMEFLASATLAERTDDDKTLVLACRKETLLLGNTAS